MQEGKSLCNQKSAGTAVIVALNRWCSGIRFLASFASTLKLTCTRASCNLALRTPCHSKIINHSFLRLKNQGPSFLCLWTTFLLIFFSRIALVLSTTSAACYCCWAFNMAVSMSMFCSWTPFKSAGNNLELKSIHTWAIDSYLHQVLDCAVLHGHVLVWASFDYHCVTIAERQVNENIVPINSNIFWKANRLVVKHFVKCACALAFVGLMVFSSDFIGNYWCRALIYT